MTSSHPPQCLSKYLRHKLVSTGLSLSLSLSLSLELDDDPAAWVDAVLMHALVAQSPWWGLMCHPTRTMDTQKAMRTAKMDSV